MVGCWVSFISPKGTNTATPSGELGRTCNNFPMLVKGSETTVCLACLMYLYFNFVFHSSRYFFNNFGVSNNFALHQYTYMLIRTCVRVAHCATYALQQLQDCGARRRRSGSGPEGGALAGPSAPTSTSTRWAHANLIPCHAWHGRGLNEVPAAAIRGMSSCREALYKGFWKVIISVYKH
jgi:putative component of membrane protein insertase Oxa1/YidC/SpoIIIJ protein YidD